MNKRIILIIISSLLLIYLLTPVILIGKSDFSGMSFTGVYLSAEEDMNRKDDMTGKEKSQEKIGSDESRIYIVLGINLVVWCALALFLFRIDRKVANLEKEMEIGRKDEI